jgi:hypothetical protein
MKLQNNLYPERFREIHAVHPAIRRVARSIQGGADRVFGRHQDPIYISVVALQSNNQVDEVQSERKAISDSFKNQIAARSDVIAYISSLQNY